MGASPSMEGRTIARPDQRPPDGVASPSVAFNGGPDNCPARRDLLAVLDNGGPQPSMEGRTIARPDPAAAPSTTSCDRRPSMEGRTIARPDAIFICKWGNAPPPFNGGPGQLPGQTPMTMLGRPVLVSPSMEGRTIARPDVRRQQDRRHSVNLQWRAGQLPGQTCFFAATLFSALILQWRAGQLPGQT